MSEFVVGGGVIVQMGGTMQDGAAELPLIIGGELLKLLKKLRGENIHEKEKWRVDQTLDSPAVLENGPSTRE